MLVTKIRQGHFLRFWKLARRFSELFGGTLNVNNPSRRRGEPTKANYNQRNLKFEIVLRNCQNHTWPRAKNSQKWTLSKLGFSFHLQECSGGGEVSNALPPLLLNYKWYGCCSYTTNLTSQDKSFAIFKRNLWRHMTSKSRHLGFYGRHLGFLRRFKTL